MQSESDQELLQKVTSLSALFDELCQQNHLEGEIDEGLLHFLKNDQMEALMAELVNVANTARYAFINLALGQDFLRNAPLGVDAMGNVAFTSAKKHWKGEDDAPSSDTSV
jgi:hypothetical protein